MFQTFFIKNKSIILWNNNIYSLIFFEIIDSNHRNILTFILATFYTFSKSILQNIDSDYSKDQNNSNWVPDYPPEKDQHHEPNSFYESDDGEVGDFFKSDNLVFYIFQFNS